MKKTTKIIVICLGAVGLFTLALIGAATLYVALNPPKKLSRAAHQQEVEGFYGAVRAGVALYRANTLLNEGPGQEHYPTRLDDQADGPCRSCFSIILNQPISNDRWTKRGNRYSYQYEDIKATMSYDPSSGQVTLNWSR